MKVPYIYKHTCSHCGRIDAIEMMHEEPVGRIDPEGPPYDYSKNEIFKFNLQTMRWSCLDLQTGTWTEYSGSSAPHE